MDGNPITEVQLQRKPTNEDWKALETLENQEKGSHKRFTFKLIPDGDSKEYYRCMARNSYGESYSNRTLLSSE